MPTPFVSMRDAFLRDGVDDWTGRNALAKSDLPAWIALLRRRARGEDLWRDWVPETHYWVLSDEDGIVGVLDLRHPLNDLARQLGGHIGYSTHPDHRGKGVATFALRAGLSVLAQWGIGEALATCLDDNVPSIRTIERAGGRRIEDSQYPGPKRRRYLIPTVK